MHERVPSEAEQAGQAVYSRRVLRLYDWFVLGLSNRWIWKCSSKHLLALYDEHVSSNHLDIGVGTGWFLDRCRFPVEAPCVVLMDLNENCLADAGARIARYNPQTIVGSILQPLPTDLGTFDSVGLNYLLHCLPGTIAEKAAAFDHLRPHLRPGATVFGSTILGAGVPRGWTARRLMGLYNKKRIFSNRDDSLDGLRAELDARFSHVEITTRGCVASFVAR